MRTPNARINISLDFSKRFEAGTVYPLRMRGITKIKPALGVATLALVALSTVHAGITVTAKRGAPHARPASVGMHASAHRPAARRAPAPGIPIAAIPTTGSPAFSIGGYAGAVLADQPCKGQSLGRTPASQRGPPIS
jgi:hypothetical protein